MRRWIAHNFSVDSREGKDNGRVGFWCTFLILWGKFYDSNYLNTAYYESIGTTNYALVNMWIKFQIEHEETPTELMQLLFFVCLVLMQSVTNLL